MSASINNSRLPNLSEAHAWRQAMLKADAFMPQAREAWTRFTDRPWNKTAMHHVLAQFAASLAEAETQP